MSCVYISVVQFGGLQMARRWTAIFWEICHISICCFDLLVVGLVCVQGLRMDCGIMQLCCFFQVSMFVLDSGWVSFFCLGFVTIEGSCKFAGNRACNLG